MISFRLLLGLVVSFTAAGPIAIDHATASQTDDRITNIQLIVDSSGSMAAETDTGALRIDSARTVLDQVVEALPDDQSVNVGLRVYGQGGNNTEAGRAESCVSSDLIVPMEGVDREALSAAVNGIVPTGWTPLAYALEQAAGDFPETEDGVTNAIIMVTDGLETCDGDPVAAAQKLLDSDIEVITSVIGFGTTDEEQDILGAIAEEGGGDLFSSGNAGELITSVVEALGNLDVQVETGSGETRLSPLGIGRSGSVGDYQVTVVSVTPDADAVVAAGYQFNETPAAGNQFFIARVAVSYTGDETGNPSFDINFQAVGDRNVGYTTFDDSCGVVPEDQYSANELFEGGSVEFNVCWEIETRDADSVAMYVESLFDFNADPVWFSIGNPIQEPVETDGERSDERATPRAESTATSDEDGGGSDRDDRETSERAGGTGRDDLLPIGETGTIGDYDVTVLAVTPLADDLVFAENQFNEPPAPGNQFYIANVSVTYTGDETGNPSFELNLQAVGASNIGYTTFENSCGVVPDDQYSAGELFEGGSVDFNVCWQIDSADVDSLAMYGESLFDFDADPVWFSLDD